MAIRIGLVGEVVAMAFDTVLTNKLRSGLTVLGVVIGITSIVGMTALIRGFDESLRALIAEAGPNIIYVERYGATSFVNGFELKEFLRRPNITTSDARALEEQATTLQYVDIEFGAAPSGSRSPAASPGGRRRAASISRRTISPRCRTRPTSACSGCASDASRETARSST